MHPLSSRERLLSRITQAVESRSTQRGENVFLGRQTLVTTANGVSDGSSHAEEVVAAKTAGVRDVRLAVAIDVVVMNFGAHEKIVPGVIANAAAKILHELVIAGVVDAAAKVAARRCKRIIEADAGDADTAEQVETSFLAQLRLIEKVEVGQNWAIVNLAGDIRSLASPPGSLDVDSETLLEANDISADAQIRAAPFCDVAGGKLLGGGRGRQYSASAEHYVALLSGGKVA